MNHHDRLLKRYWVVYPAVGLAAILVWEAAKILANALKCLEQLGISA